VNKVFILPDNIVNQIAAGEVVENPSAVVKELIENSIDSKAKEIKIIILKGGQELIQVTDDGEGMSLKDLETAFLRHATSKIKNQKDLESIKSLGFRGEALPSIASVSRVSMISSNGSEANKIILSGGKISSIEKNSGKKGTKIKVKNLFFNTPARKKFLKSSNQEIRNITKIIKRFMLSYPEISFLYKVDNKIVYKFNKVKLKDRVIQLFGSSYSNNIIEVNGDNKKYKVFGYIGSLNLVQRRRGGQYLFLNGRFINNISISNSIRNCYDSVMQRGEFPFYVLFLELPPALFDINVHPTKIEAKFSEKWNVINFVNFHIKSELKKLFKVLPDISFDSKISKAESELKLDLEMSGILDLKSEDGITNKFISSDSIESNSKVGKAFDRLDDYENKIEPILDKNAQIWQIHNKYLITEINSGLLIIDQHVAHERVLYEKVKKAFDSKPLPSQSILFPKTIIFDPEDFSKFLDIVPFLEKIGYKMREFGDNTIIIEGVPSDIKWGNEEDIINDILDRYIEYDKISSNYIDYIAATYSCKAAVKAGDFLELQERKILIDNLFATKNPYYCPHGRPIVISIKTEELDKRFERK
jgi:DNA mismatch repair protein MutL